MVGGPRFLRPLGRYSAPQGDEIGVWAASLADTLPEAQAARLLEPEEHARAARFRFPHLRRRFVVGRALLRLLLADLLDTDAAALRFRYGPWGKPELVGEALRFNVSHSEDLAVFAVTERAPLGVDVEIERPIPEADALARMYFSAVEQRALAAAADDAKVRIFFTCWTRKEAYVKGLGEGLHRSLQQRPDKAWRILDLEIARGAVAALAVCLPS